MTTAGALRGRVAVVTGASAGIGAAIAREVSRLGAAVVLNARRRERLEALAREIEGGGGRAAVVAGDAAEEGVIAAMLDAAAERFGREADLVVVNAGRGLRGSPLTSDAAAWEEVTRVNFVGAVRLLRAAGERMVRDAERSKPAPGARGPVESLRGSYSSEGARGQAEAAARQAPGDWPGRARDIVVMSSSVGKHISPFSSLYGATKFAVTAAAEAARRELAPRGIRVSAVHPGVVSSEFQDVAGYDPVTFGEFMERIGPALTPEDVARVVGFMVSQPAGVLINDVMLRPTRQEYP